MPTITDTDQYRETRGFWQSIASKTNSLLMVSFAIYGEGNKILKPIPLNDNKPLSPDSAYSLLKNENAWYKNQKHNKSVLWKFADNQTYNIAIVDDIQKVDDLKEKDIFLLWQTSENKYQAAFLLDKYVDAETIKKIQRVIIDQYGGDKACLGASHFVRVPGFFNTKYLERPPLVKLIHRGKNVLSVNQLLQYYESILKPKESITKNNTKTLPSTPSNYRTPDEKKKDWWYYYNIKQDNSSADFSYALYLMHFNLSDDEIKQTLLAESVDIELRKKGHLEDYLERTVSKARACFTPFKKET